MSRMLRRMDDEELVYVDHILRLDGTMLELVARYLEETLRLHVNLATASVQPTGRGDMLEVRVGLGGTLDTPLLQDKVTGGSRQFQVPISETRALAEFFAEAQRRRVRPRAVDHTG